MASKVSTIVQYFNGDSDLKLTPSAIPRSQDNEKPVLQYDVAVRDLGAVNPDQIVRCLEGSTPPATLLLSLKLAMQSIGVL
jgi:hypothetical protein